MKKSFLIIFVIIAVLVAVICALAFGGALDKDDKTSSTTTTTTASTTTTTNQDPPSPEITFEHGDNFTEDDIEFVKMLHGQSPFFSHLEKPYYNLQDIIFQIKLNTPLLFISPDIDNGYFICPYIDLDLLSSDEKEKLEYMPIDVTLYTWYKFYISEEVPYQIGDLELYERFSHILFDCSVTSVFSQDGTESTNRKYIIKCYPSRLESGIEHISYFESMLLLDPYQNITNGKYRGYIYRNGTNVTNVPDYQLRCYVNENGEKYRVSIFLEGSLIDGEPQINEALAKEFFGKYYDQLFSHLVFLPELYRESSTGQILYSYGLPLDEFVNVVSELLK